MKVKTWPCMTTWTVNGTIIIVIHILKSHAIKHGRIMPCIIDVRPSALSIHYNFCHSTWRCHTHVLWQVTLHGGHVLWHVVVHGPMSQYMAPMSQYMAPYHSTWPHVKVPTKSTNKSSSIYKISGTKLSSKRNQLPNDLKQIETYAAFKDKTKLLSKQ